MHELDQAPARSRVGMRSHVRIAHTQGTARSLRADATCLWCEKHPDQYCPSCAARRTHAVRLARAGASVSDVAKRLDLPVARVERLLEEEADRRELACIALPDVSNARLRELLAKQQQIEPTLTVAELARRLGTSHPQVERWLGLRETAPKTGRGGRTYPGRLLGGIGVDAAGRIARAIGFLPCDVDHVV